MKEDVFEVLMYLFENYAERDVEFSTDQTSMTKTLLQAGFIDSEIEKAFEWLEGLVLLKEKTLPHARPNKTSMRAYSHQEKIKLNLQCRGYLLHLEQIDVVNEITRELIIDRCMALETDNFNLDHFKWVVLLVLFNHSESDEQDDGFIAKPPTDSSTMSAALSATTSSTTSAASGEAMEAATKKTAGMPLWIKNIWLVDLIFKPVPPSVH